MRRLADLLQECELHLLSLHESIGRMPQPLTEEHLLTRIPDVIAALDQFAYRFVKLQNVMSVKLFRSFAVEHLREPVENVPVIDILNLLERYKWLPSVERWQQIREMRNQITHEYLLQPDELVVAIANAVVMVREMEHIVVTLRTVRA